MHQVHYQGTRPATREQLEETVRLGDGLEPAGTAAIVPLATNARQTYKLIVQRELYELIQSLDLAPGDRLIEAHLAGRFGISKTPVREALLMLEAEGLVTTVPHVGTTVTWLRIEDYEQHLFILDALELPALRLVVDRITEERLKTCQKLLNEVGAAFKRRDRDRFGRGAVEIHAQIFGAVRYPKLTDLVRDQQRRLRRYTEAFVHQFEENWQREYDIVLGRMAKIRERDPDGAGRLAQQGHAIMLEFARRKVAERDPAVMSFIEPETR